MAIGPDLNALDAFARQLESHAEELSVRFTHTSVEVQHSPWRCAAAERLRDLDGTCLTQAGQVREELLAAAADLRRHARVAAERAAQLNERLSRLDPSLNSVVNPVIGPTP